MDEKSDSPKQGFATRAVHAGEGLPTYDSQPTSTPVYNASSFVAPSVDDIDAILGGSTPGYVYTRDGNPTVAALETAVADLEETEGAVAFASGMAAVHAALLAAGLRAGDRVVASRDCYGRTYALLSTLFREQGVTVDFVDIGDPASLDQALSQPVSVLFVETMSNPLLKVAGVPALAQRARQAGARFVVDSTFTTPLLIRPCALGTDIVLHSATKYLGGHGDVTGGIACASGEMLDRLRGIVKLVGGILGPNEAWLCLRGLKTLPLRVIRQCENACTVAQHLSQHPRVSRVYYPGLVGDPGYALAGRLFGGNFGAMVSFDVRDGAASQVLAFMRALKLVAPGPTLGDVWSLVLYPAQASHRGLSAEERHALGIGDGLVRLSIGIENVEDIIGDLDQALAAIVY